MGSVDRQYFCSGLAMVMAVNVGDILELPRLSCLRRHILGNCQDAGWGGEAWSQRVVKVILPHTRCGGGFRGGVAGAEPPHKGGPNRPDRPEKQWSVVSGQWSVISDQWSVKAQIDG